MHKPSHNKVALVTGSARGIGRAIILQLARDGFDVVLNYKDSKSEARSVSEIFRLNKIKHLVVRADISKEEDVKKLFRQIINKFGKLDILINNAGVNQIQSFRNLKIKDFQKICDVNLIGAMLVTKYALPLLDRSDDPRIIFIGSPNAFIGSVNKIAYNTSKAALIGLVKSLALELAPKILVNAVIPGYINTSLMKNFSIKSNSARIKRIPLRRIGLPEDIAGVVSFLVSRGASYIHGQSIHVNGGLILT